MSEQAKPLAKEAGDLYRLAKRALEEAVDAEPEPKPAPSNTNDVLGHTLRGGESE